MSDSDQLMNTDAGLSVTTTGEITVAAVIILFILLVVTLILYLRAKGYSGAIGSPRSRRLAFAPHQPTLPRQALDPSILNSLPVTAFRSEDFNEDGGLECAVCLSELTDGEEARLLPKCNHGFHVECIDMWFHSNSTCPLCRCPVGPDSTIESSVEIPIEPLEVVSETGHSAETPYSPANMNEGSSSSEDSSSSSSSSLGKREEGMLVIEIPRREVEGFSLSNSRLPSGRPLAEGIKSPVLERLTSLKRILGRGC